MDHTALFLCIFYIFCGWKLDTSGIVVTLDTDLSPSCLCSLFLFIVLFVEWLRWTSSLRPISSAVCRLWCLLRRCSLGHAHSYPNSRPHLGMTVIIAGLSWTISFSSFTIKFFYLTFSFFWLHWVFVAAHRLSLVAVSLDYSNLQCTAFSLQRLLVLQSTGCRHTDFSSCDMGSEVVAHGLSCSTVCKVLPDQGLNPCPLHWQADS